MNKKIVARIIARIVSLAGVAAFFIALSDAPARAQQEFGSPELIAAAKAEGKLVYYTANFAEVEQQVIKEFNKRFPEIKIEMVRAPGGQLITRVKTEAAAGKLIADVVDHSDRALMQPLADMFQDYAPPNAADYNPDAQIAPKLWPRATLVWSIAYNTELVKNPPKTWMDLTKPEYDKHDRTGVRPIRRHHLDPHHVRAPGAGRGLLGQAGLDASDTLSLGCADVGFAGARRGRHGPLALQRDLSEAEGRRADQDLLPARRRAGQSLCHGNSEDRGPPQRRETVPQLVPVEGGADLHDQGTRQSHVAEGSRRSIPKASIRRWSRSGIPKFDDYVKLHGPWVADWDKIFGYRQ